MNTQNVKQIIQELARDNYRLYSDGWCYRPEGGELDGQERTIAKGVAEGYLYNRNDDEIELDEKLGITKSDYRNWVIEAIEEAAKERAESLRTI